MTSIIGNFPEVFFIKYLLSSISLVVSAVVSGTMNTLLRRLCSLNKTTEILWTEGVCALNQTV